MKAGNWVPGFRADIDQLLATYARIEAKLGAFQALGMAETLTDGDCGNNTAVEVLAAVGSFQALAGALGSSDHAKNLYTIAS